MKKFWNHLGFMLGIALAGAVQGEEVGFSSMFEEGIARGEEPIRLVSIDNEVATSTFHSVPASKSACSVTAEMPLLSVHANHGSGAGVNNWFHEFDTNAGLRVTAAYQSPGILGLRGRFFMYDTTGSIVPVDRFDLRLYDLEATTGLNVGGWNLLGFGGVRWGSIEFSNRFSNTFEHFDGVGMTCGADIRRNVGHGLTLVGGMRQSYLYGESEVNVFPVTLNNVVIPITEFRLGTDYAIRLPNNNKLIAGVGFEHQQFSSLSVRNANIDPEDVDVSLSGPVFSLTWLR